MPKVARVFEYDRLRIGEQGLTVSHYERLAAYSEKNQSKFFRPGHRCIHFRGHVGVLQVGGLTIEILPKADRGTADQNKWRNALLEMLKTCRLIKLESMTNANLRLRSASMVDLYFHTFLDQVQDIIHGGLAKGYRQKNGNLTSLKGSIDFPRHITHNLIHRERFYTRHTVYDRDKLHNQLLKKALVVLQASSANPHISARASEMLLHFEDVSDIRVTQETFQRVTFHRNTERYRAGLQLARLIILNYTPDLRGGREHVLAILFDMPMLYEDYFYRLLKRAEPNFPGIRVERQRSATFWQGESMSKTIRPDVVIETQDGRKLILDTKWKVPKDNRPSDSDLKQMYAYNIQFGAKDSILVYPKVEGLGDIRGEFKTSHELYGNHVHTCCLHFMELFVQGGDTLDRDAGKHVLSSLPGVVASSAE
jgi:5-methylcytosine-specific restriction enzyme subunit McrC